MLRLNSWADGIWLIYASVVMIVVPYDNIYGGDLGAWARITTVFNVIGVDRPNLGRPVCAYDGVTCATSIKFHHGVNFLRSHQRKVLAIGVMGMRFGPHQVAPPMTLLGVTRLAMPGLMFEIEATGAA